MYLRDQKKALIKKYVEATQKDLALNSMLMRCRCTHSCLTSSESFQLLHKCYAWPVLVIVKLKPVVCGASPPCSRNCKAPKPKAKAKAKAGRKRKRSKTNVEED